MVNVIVCGPESSGTRFVSRWLEAHPEVVARHWSMPSGGRWMRHWPTDHDFDADPPAALIFVVRDFFATVASQVHHGHVSSEAEAEANIIQARLRAFSWAVAHGIPVLPLVYDSIVEHPARMRATFRWLGVDPVPCPLPIHETSSKWYDSGEVPT